MTLRPKTINLLDCWLYARVYREISPDSQLGLQEAQRRALLKARPPKLVGVPPDKIKQRIAQHFGSNTWRRPPMPEDQEAKNMFPDWRQWHQEPTPSQDTGKAKATPPHPSTANQANPSAASPSSSAHRPTAQDSPLASPSMHQPPQSSPAPSAPRADQSARRKCFRDTGYNQRVFSPDSDTDQKNTTPPWEASEEMPSTTGKPLQGGWKKNTRSMLTFSDLLFPSDLNTHAQDRHEIDTILSTAPLFTSDTLHIDAGPEDHPGDVVIQSGILAKIQQQQTATGGQWTPLEPEEKAKINDILLLNTTTPWTTFICGLQGAGKSHSLSVILENCLIPNKSIGVLARPLSALVLYYAPFTPIDAGKPCEVAYLAVSASGSENGLSNSQGPTCARSVTVLASRSNLGNMKLVYGKIPGVTVRPLLLKPSQLTIKTMLHLMSVQRDNNALYMQVVTRILRDMAAENPINFNYEKFKDLLSEESLTPLQWGPLEMRLELLESFIGSESNPSPFNPVPGGITIVDLTCPFVDAETACVLFSICLELYTSAPSDTGKIVALDEAHKFMGNQTSSQEFANSVIQNIRLQRHLGLRTIISTQDPQVHPELLELASFVLMHRFDSPRWFATLRHHVGFDEKNNESASAEEQAEANKRAATAFDQIMRLNTGEAYLYCPQLVTVELRTWREEIARLGNRLLKVRVRRRLTKDGGVSKNVL
ncbi:hypothetical protein TWF696_001143 [Orbilia brochopaga]|uniref:P-loop containing nucleoside triphosphate hydrolase protein n=1 Tax=Orbilia brochopaga TaxID=3140254 RepID=A0AAV9VE14_9PEZI